MSDGLSDHQGIFMPLLILAVLLVMVFVLGILGGIGLCYLLG